MAQAKARQQSQDPYAQRGKTLASLVQRLRGWVGSDPSRALELADALVELTAHRLLGHFYAAAAADAQDSVRRAGEILAASGPIGPYTSLRDAARYVTAVVHMAAIQAGLGLPDAAGRTIESLQDIREQLRGNGLEQRLESQTAIWALSCSARAALTSGDTPERTPTPMPPGLGFLAESDLRNDPPLPISPWIVDRLASRLLVGGRQGREEALPYLYAAKSRYDDVVGGRLEEPARLSPALPGTSGRAALRPVSGMADRLAGAARPSWSHSPGGN